MAPKVKYTKELLEPLVKSSISNKDLLIKLGINYNSGTHSSIPSLIKKFGIDDSHFYNHELSSKRRSSYTNEEIFIKDSKMSRNVVRYRVIKEKLIPYVCECCGQDEKWQGKIMPLILDHKNGINNDNELSNLRFLCSNCDSIQDTYKSKNRSLDQIKQTNRNLIIKESNKIERKSIRNEKIKNYINQIKDSNIDFTKHGYLVEIGKLLNWTPQWSQKFIIKHLPEIDKICKKHT
jgi:hypothetical protein